MLIVVQVEVLLQNLLFQCYCAQCPLLCACLSERKPQCGVIWGGKKLK